MELGGRRAQHAREHLRRRRLLEMLHAREAEARRREAAKGRGASVLGRLVVVAQRVQRARDHLARTCTVAALRRRARSLDHSPHAHSRSLSTRALSITLHTRAHTVHTSSGAKAASGSGPSQRRPPRRASLAYDANARFRSSACIRQAARCAAGHARMGASMSALGRGLARCAGRGQVQRTRA